VTGLLEDPEDPEPLPRVLGRVVTGVPDECVAPLEVPVVRCVLGRVVTGATADAGAPVPADETGCELARVATGAEPTVPPATAE
jgi:hypothetical protein